MFATFEVSNPETSREESAYYFYWRSMVRKGKYLRTSKGYLFLFTAEIINTDTGAKDNLRMLANVIKVYSALDQFLLDSIPAADPRPR